jgi:hypothetical protein
MLVAGAVARRLALCTVVPHRAALGLALLLAALCGGEHRAPLAPRPGGAVGRRTTCAARLRGGSASAILGTVYTPSDSDSDSDSAASGDRNPGVNGAGVSWPPPDVRRLLRPETKLAPDKRHAGRGEDLEWSAESDTARAVSQIHLGDEASRLREEGLTMEDAGGGGLGGRAGELLEERLMKEWTRLTTAASRPGLSEASQGREGTAQDHSDMAREASVQEDLLHSNLNEVEGVEILGSGGGGLMMVGPAARFIFSKALSSSAVQTSDPEGVSPGAGDGSGHDLEASVSGRAGQGQGADGEERSEKGRGPNVAPSKLATGDQHGGGPRMGGRRGVACRCGGGSLCMSSWASRDEAVSQQDKIARLRCLSAHDEAAFAVSLASAGEEHVVIVCSDGRVLAAGSNEYGQLGIGHMCGGLAGAQVKNVGFSNFVFRAVGLICHMCGGLAARRYPRSQKQYLICEIILASPARSCLSSWGQYWNCEI